MIFEAILGTEGPRFAPMGAECAALDWEIFTLRPFFTSRTAEALVRTGKGVLNFTDDVSLFARTALTDEIPPSCGPVLEGACIWVCVAVTDAARHEGRWRVTCKVTDRHFTRPLSPFNRGTYAALEALVLATRTHLPGFDRPNFLKKLDELEHMATRTGGSAEIETFKLIRAIHR